MLHSGTVGATGSGNGGQFLEHAASQFDNSPMVPKRRKRRNGLEVKANKRALDRFYVVMVAFMMTREALKEAAHDQKAYSWNVGEPTPTETQQILKDGLRTARRHVSDKTGIRMLKWLFGCLSWSEPHMSLLGIMPQSSINNGSPTPTYNCSDNNGTPTPAYDYLQPRVTHTHAHGNYTHDQDTHQSPSPRRLDWNGLAPHTFGREGILEDERSLNYVDDGMNDS